MAQWDVYVNPSARLRNEIPYLVDLQSNLLSGLMTRLVVPLARSRLDTAGLPRRICPVFMIEGVTVVLLPQESGSVEARALKHRVVSLGRLSHHIIDALDAVVSGV